MRNLTLVSLSALALAACAPKEVAVTPAPAAEPTAAPAPYAPVIPKGTGIFAEPSTLPFQTPDFTRIKDSDFQPAIEQGIASGVPSYLLTQALRIARDRGAITADEHRRLTEGLEARS